MRDKSSINLKKLKSRYVYIRPPYDCPGYDIKQFGGENLVTGNIWAIRRAPSSLLLPNNKWIYGTVVETFGWKVFLSKIMWMLQVQSQLQVRITRDTNSELTLLPGHG